MENREKVIKGIRSELVIKIGDELLMGYPKVDALIQGTAVYQALINTEVKDDIDIEPAAALILGELRETRKV